MIETVNYFYLIDKQFYQTFCDAQFVLSYFLGGEGKVLGFCMHRRASQYLIKNCFVSWSVTLVAR